MKIGVLGIQPESVLGTVDQSALCGLFSDIYKIANLSEQQMVGHTQNAVAHVEQMVE
jgi:hypothetical protein